MKLLLRAEELSANQSRSLANKLFKKVLNDSAKSVTQELKKGFLLGVAWKINSWIAKVIQGRSQDKLVKFGISHTVIEYLFIKIFLDDEDASTCKKKVEDAAVRFFAEQNKDTHWKKDAFDVSFQDITNMMKKVIDSI
jgi:hypothetical protein